MPKDKASISSENLLPIVDSNLKCNGQHPRPDQVALVVAVADSTLSQDCEVKDKLYAQAGITDYWVVDLPHRQLHIFRDPTPKSYTRHLILTEPNFVAPLAFSNCRLALTTILPPAD